jgi:hypothetical protein
MPELVLHQIERHPLQQGEGRHHRRLEQRPRGEPDPERHERRPAGSCVASHPPDAAVEDGPRPLDRHLRAPAGIGVIGGYLGLVTAVLAGYASFAGVLDATWKRTVLPVGVR